MTEGAPLLCVTTEEEILLTSIVSTCCQSGLSLVEHSEDSCIDRLLSIDLRSRDALEALTERNVSVKVCQHTPVDGVQNQGLTKNVALRCIDTTLRTLLDHLIDVVKV